MTGDTETEEWNAAKQEMDVVGKHWTKFLFSNHLRIKIITEAHL